MITLKAALITASCVGTVAVGGATAWQAPGGAGVLVFDQNGYSLFLNGSPALSGDLKDVAAALRQAG